MKGNFLVYLRYVVPLDVPLIFTTCMLGMVSEMVMEHETHFSVTKYCCNSVELWIDALTSVSSTIRKHLIV